MTDESQIPNELFNNKNKQQVRCQYCNSLILKEQEADSYLETEIDLPLMHQKNTKDVEALETELLRHFWVINDMFTFENVGFSNTVGTRKYLGCADCDMGPVGYQDIESKQCFVALRRVKHGGEDAAIANGQISTQ